MTTPETTQLPAKGSGPWDTQGLLKLVLAGTFQTLGELGDCTGYGVEWAREWRDYVINMGHISPQQWCEVLPGLPAVVPSTLDEDTTDEIIARIRNRTYRTESELARALGKSVGWVVLFRAALEHAGKMGADEWKKCFKPTMTITANNKGD